MTYKTGNWGSQAKERSKKRLEYFNKYRKKHRQESYKPKRDKNRILLRDLRPRVLEKYGNKCIKCGFDDIRALQIDHINGNCLDNRRFNLRLCNNIENNQNRKIDKRNSSGYKGVYFDKIRKKWVAEIKVNKCKKFIGRFINKEEAAIAYNKFAKKYFKKFAVLNDIK